MRGTKRQRVLKHSVYDFVDVIPQGIHLIFAFFGSFLKHTYCLYMSTKSCSHSKLISCSYLEAELQNEAV